MPAGTKDYYGVLGVERTATPEEIKRAFRRKAREVHPDVNRADDAEERFKELNEAYDVLSDPQKRDMYDRYGTVGRGVGGPTGYPGGGFGDAGDFFGGGVTMEDLFSSFFGGVYGARGGQMRTEGRDMVMALTITLQEAAEGVSKEITLDRLATCDVCGGSGAGPDGKVVTCPTCGGTGQQVEQRRTFLGMMQTVAPCQTCGATGQVIENPCPECQGSGRVPDRERITLDIPAGIAEGQQVRVRGMGEAGIRGAAAGDLLVSIRIKQDDFIHRQGNDLHCSARVTITQAALGADLTVCGVLGEENEVSIPSGTQHGETIKVKGKGMPHLRGDGRGDLYIHIDLEVPKKLSKRQKELLEELAEEFGDSTRFQERSPLQKLKDWLTG
ncbi:MAG: molecular chaperone DnaJ [Coriobacteriales bacterium]|nr:molecular chaperone DnaJ [Coriobacteriales bacterium]